MCGEKWDRCELAVTAWADLFGVVLMVVLLMADRCVAVVCVVRAVPMVRPCFRALLKDLPAALRTEDIVAKTEVLMKS